MAMFVRLPIVEPSDRKKSMRTFCNADEVLPIAISVDQSPPAATCAKTKEAAPPIEDVDTVETADGAGGGKPNPNPGKTPVAGGKPKPKPEEASAGGADEVEG